MYQIIASILFNFGLGFLSDTFRTYYAEKLRDGDLADQKLRDWIGRELDDIKSKLNGLSRKDLATSISSLKKGVERLHMCFGESTESVDPSTSEMSKKEEQSQDTTNVRANTSTLTNPAQRSVAVEDALRLADAIRKLKIKSNEIFELAKQSFKKAEDKASDAFHNTALSTEERVLASEVRIVSGILEHLELPEVAANDCLGYLQELHDMSAIQDIFSVQVQGGIKSFLKSRFKRDSRAAIVETVTMINLMLAHFISKFTERRMAVFEWPVIKCSKRVVHPIYYNEESARKMKEMGITAPWNIVKQKETEEEFCRSYAINSKGDVIGVYYHGGLVKFDKTTGEVQPFCYFRSDNKTRCESFIAIDDKDTVYVLSYKMNTSTSVNHETALSVYSSDGEITLHCSLDFIRKQPQSIAVTKDQKIVIRSTAFPDKIAHVYVCDSLNGTLIKTFPIPLQSEIEQVNSMIVSHIDKSFENEIILATQEKDLTNMRLIVRFYVCTQEGRLNSIPELPLPLSWPLFSPSSILFDHVTKSYIVCCGNEAGKTRVEFFSETGQKRKVLCLDDIAYITGSGRELHPVSHANGVIAMVNKDRIRYLHSSI